ncbi:MAG: hypothetical protein QOI47_1936 [Actinomycetota bacterium]|jgi:glucose/arabinose dehydrogenase|nr:hypothetical protein [Actinomycetota bacterium]
MTRAVTLAFALAVLGAGCGGSAHRAPISSATTTASSSSTSTSSSSSTASPAVAALGTIKITLTQVASLHQPLDFAVRTATPGFYVAEKGGRVQYLSGPGASPVQVLDISRVIATGAEQGLLGMTFSPDGTKLYVYFTMANGFGRLEELTMGAGATQVVGSERVLLDFEDHYPNHNGGRIAFGPDGRLYLGLGDGGGRGDPDRHAQDPKALNGKLLKLDVTNPANPERYAIGLRNPWRFSFDRANGDIWIGDVGQDRYEEIDRIAAGTPSGVNLGWNRFEATHPYQGSSDRAGLLFPVYEYGHDAGQSVVGGFVYRGTKVPALQGVYLFTDTYRGNLHALRVTGANVEHADLGVTAPKGFVVSFGEDANGELYVLSLNGGVYRIDQG